MKIGVTFPQIEFGNDAHAIRDYAQTVEALGFSHILAYDHVVGANPNRPGGWNGPYTYQNPFHEPFLLFSYMAAVTQKIEFVNKIGPLFFISCLANIGWIFAWHYQILPLSLVFMLILLGCLLAVFLRLKVGKSEAAKAERYFAHLPFSVYLGWITIATIANVTALLVDINWNTWGLGQQFWAVAVIIVGIAIALSVLFTRKDIFYCLVVDWALLGILLKRLSDTAMADQSVVIVTIAGLALITGGVIAQSARRKVY